MWTLIMLSYYVIPYINTVLFSQFCTFHPEPLPGPN